MYCKNCGNQLPDNASFCNSCGSAVGNNQTPSPSDNFNAGDNTVAYNADNTPAYQSSLPPASAPVPTGEKKKTGLYIALAAVGAVLVIALTVVLVVILGGDKNTTEESTTASRESTIKSELLDDPITYFIQQPDGYYKVTTDTSADFYIYPEYGSEEHYATRFAGNELILVYGTSDGWACFEYEDSATGYAWCKTASIYKTNEQPTEAVPETVYVETYIPVNNPEPSYSYVSPGSTYRVKNTSGKGLNLRESPSTSAYRYCVLWENELVYVYKTNGSWAYVRVVGTNSGYYGYEGWCATQYLSYAY